MLKHDGQWFLDPAYAQRASRDAVTAITDAIVNGRIESFVKDKPQDMGLYGLAKPSLTLTLYAPAIDTTTEPSDSGQPEITYTLRLGSTTDLTEQQYFATWSVGDEPSPVIFTLRKSDIAPLLQSTADLRDPHLITTEAREIQAINVTRPDQAPLHLKRDIDQGFVFSEPATASAPASTNNYGVDYDTATALLEHLAQAKATSYVPDFNAPAKALATVEITPRGSALMRRFACMPPSQSKAKRKSFIWRCGKMSPWRTVSRPRLWRIFSSHAWRIATKTCWMWIRRSLRA